MNINLDDLPEDFWEDEPIPEHEEVMFRGVSGFYYFLEDQTEHEDE